jgi:hypothetical protein
MPILWGPAGLTLNAVLREEGQVELGGGRREFGVYCF